MSLYMALMNAIMEPTSPPMLSQSQPFLATATAVAGSPVENPTYLPWRCAVSIILSIAACTFASKLSVDSQDTRDEAQQPVLQTN